MAFKNNYPKKIFKGNWECAQCHESITELPFEPNPHKMNKLLCKECFSSKKKSFRNFKR